MRTCCSSNRPPWQAPTTSTSTPCSLNIRRLVQNCRLSNATPRKGKPMMSAQLNDPFTPELQDVLSNLAAGLFGFDAWIKQPGKYKPPLPDEDLPWRAAGHTFSPSDLGVIPFFEGLLREDSGEDDLFDRWAELAANPLRFSPIHEVQEWRKNRGLAGVAQFGVTRSANVLLT